MPTSPRPHEVQAMLDEIARSAPFASIDALNAQLARRVQAYNTTPQAELGGLSPDRMAQLLYGDWTTAGAFRVVDEAPVAPLLDVPLVADARLIMAYIDANAPVKLTATGNLTRAAVAALVPMLRTEAHNNEESSRIEYSVRNEDDVRWLPVLKHLLLFGRIVTKRKGLLLSSRGRTLLPEQKAGELFVQLFLTLFRRFDLRYLYSGTPHLGLQQTLPYSFYQISRTADDWTPLAALGETAWLPSARDPLQEWELTYADTRFSAFRYRVLEPLVHFGLLERRLLPGDTPYPKRAEFRRTPLFEQLLRFSFEEG
jgi:hypothetical protein